MLASGLAAITLVACGQPDVVPTPKTDEEIVASQMKMRLNILDPQSMKSAVVALEREREHERGECMRGAGFNYKDAPVDSLISFRPLGNPFDPAYAAEFGVGLSTSQQPSLSSNPNDRTYSDLESGERDAWSRSYESCRTQSSETSRERRLADLAAQLDDLQVRSFADAAVIAESGQFQACMNERGYEGKGTTPYEVVSLLFDEYARFTSSGSPADQFVTHEIDTAIANAACGERYLMVQDRVLRELVESESNELFGMLYP